jgi:hypothetical protein
MSKTHRSISRELIVNAALKPLVALFYGKEAAARAEKNKFKNKRAGDCYKKL